MMLKRRTIEAAPAAAAIDPTEPSPEGTYDVEPPKIGPDGFITSEWTRWQWADAERKLRGTDPARASREAQERELDALIERAGTIRDDARERVVSAKADLNELSPSQADVNTVRRLERTFREAERLWEAACEAERALKHLRHERPRVAWYQNTAVHILDGKRLGG